MIDTNIMVSALSNSKGSVSKRLKFITIDNEIWLCSFAIEEFKDIINSKFNHLLSYMNDFLNEFDYELFITPERLKIEDYPYLRDEDDIPILASAMLADVDALLTGDKDLLTVKIDRPEILTIKDFVDKYY